MGKRVFTDEQLSAINTRDKSLLVSAAAGSGKTATLTERIIRSVSDENGEDISRMLIVTFTNAAVAELRERISAALKEKLLENPENERLERQLYMLPSARISTIDSFCNDLLKSNAERFGISPRYRIADPTEAKLLTHSVLSGLIDAIYEGELPEICEPRDFEELSFCLAGVKNDSALEEVFELLYEKSKSCESGVDIFKEFADRLSSYSDIPIEENPYGAYAMRRAKEASWHYICLLKSLAETLDSDDKYIATVDADLLILQAIEKAETYSAMKTALEVKFPSLPPIRKEKSEEQTSLASVRAEMKKAFSEQIKPRYFEYSEKEWREHISALLKVANTLARFLKKFDSVFFEEKKNRAILEYSDIERLTYLSLYDKNGEPSELALSEREKYSSVYIDEYQDVNALQNKIFLAVSKPNNRFTVGDIKQSIYGFRSARPDIFKEMKNSYPQLEKAQNSDTASVFMSKNFRCDRGIVDFVNAVFDTAFSLCRDSIGYVNEDKLEFSKITEGGEPPYTNPEVMLFASGDDTLCTEGASARDLIPLWTAKKIKELINSGRLNSGKAIEPKDIAVIIRKDGGRIALYADALKSLGIPARTAESKDFFLNPEIQLALCLLNTINNPMRDIHLAGLMLSPLFGFTPDELYKARRIHGISLWDSVKKYSSQNPEDTKFSSFISSVNRYRAVSEGMRADELILKLYAESGILALATKDGSRENLMLLYDYAKKFEASSFEGLYNFIDYINTVIESGASFSTNKENDGGDSVTITTVHKSKGLEYPVVFLVDATSELISRNERSVRVSFSEELGIGMKLRAPEGLALVDSPIHNVIIDRNSDLSIEEELRVYYVALTRAREKLYIVGAPKTESQDDFEAVARLRKLRTTPYTMRELKTFIDILFLSPTNAHICWASDRDPDIYDILHGDNLNAQKTINISESRSEKTSFDSALYDTVSERFSYEYPRSHLTVLPEKLSISALSPSVLDGSEEESGFFIDSTPKTENNVLGILPEFMAISHERESSARGIATHNFMQFFSVENLLETGVEKELSRLVRDGFISEKNASLVRLDEVELFRKSELYGEMRKAKKLYREFRFSVMLPAPLFTLDDEKKELLRDEKILLQGVIDCIVADADGRLHLIDYKTDRLSKNELSDKALAQKKLCEKHRLQLSYYALAIEKIFGKRPDTTRIYSLPLGDTVDV